MLKCFKIDVFNGLFSVPPVEMSDMVAYWYCDYFMILGMQKYQIRRGILLVNYI